MDKLKISLIASSILITSASAIDITQFPKLFDDNGTDLIEEFDLDPRIFSTLLGGTKISNSAMKDGLGLFVYVPTNKDQRYINQNSLETYYELIDGYDDNGTLEEYIGIIPIDPEIEELIDNGLIRFPIRPPASNELIILPNGTVTCSTATPGEFLDDGNGNRYYVVDNTTIRNVITSDPITYNFGSSTFEPTYVCTSLVTDTSHLFDLGEAGFAMTNPINIANWDVSNVTNMAYMFAGLAVDAGDLVNWDVSNVTDMSFMFSYYKYGSTLFKPNVTNWNVSNVTNMSNMFSSSPFNQDISNWNVSNVTNMSYMLDHTPFNQDISSWNVANVVDFNYMFYSTPFNQPIGNWDVSNATDLSRMFAYSSFNQDLSSWNISNVTNIYGMFSGTPFNQDISSWDTSKVTNMSYLFYGTQFNKPIDNWDTSNVINMSDMFENSIFNQPIGSWNTINVKYMGRMFYGNSAFDQDISGWNVSNVVYSVDFDTNTNANWIAAEKPTFP